MSPTEILEKIDKEGIIIDMVIGDFYMPSFNRSKSTDEPLRKKKCAGKGCEQRIIMMSHEYKDEIIRKMPEEPAKLYNVPYQFTIPKKKGNKIMNICMEVIKQQGMENSPDSFVLVDDNPLGSLVASEMLTNFTYTTSHHDSATAILNKFSCITWRNAIIVRYFSVPSLQSDYTKTSKVPYLSMPSDYLLNVVKSLSRETGLKLFTFKPKTDQHFGNYMNAIFWNELEMAGTMCGSGTTDVNNMSSTDNKKTRMKWNDEDCKAFEQAYWKLSETTGKATAAAIKKEMKNNTISTAQTASHLQKFRTKLSKWSSSERTTITEMEAQRSTGELQVSSSLDPYASQRESQVFSCLV